LSSEQDIGTNKFARQVPEDIWIVIFHKTAQGVAVIEQTHSVSIIKFYVDHVDDLPWVKPVFGEAAGKMETVSKISKWLSFSALGYVGIDEVGIKVSQLYMATVYKSG
jgi:hypothetical protein